MEPQIRQLVRQLKSARLARDEKKALRQKLVAELGLVESAAWWRFPAYLAAPLLLLVFISTGVSQAAEGALPGDWLYVVKTKINEPVARVLVAPEQKAELELKLVEKRLAEAEAILTEEADEKTEVEVELKDEIKEEIARQAARAHEEKDEDESEDEIKQILQKHEQVLKRLEKDDEKRDNVRGRSDGRQNKGRD